MNCCFDVSRRFIPARAGNGCIEALVQTFRPVHPRACGERCLHFALTAAIHGSSPRVRGTGVVLHRDVLPGRFIPARAGNGGAEPLAGRVSSVHPRACGERLPAPSRSLSVFGSSPRVRGTVGFRLLLAGLGRFIPARAGNGQYMGSTVTTVTVHPRACGERAAYAIVSHAQAGSSPRVRGTVVPRKPQTRLQRFIPARAGNGRRPAPVA